MAKRGLTKGKKREIPLSQMSKAEYNARIVQGQGARRRSNGDFSSNALEAFTGFNSRDGVDLGDIAGLAMTAATLGTGAVIKSAARRATAVGLRDTIIAKGGVTINSKAMKVVSPKRGYAVGITNKTAVKVPVKKASAGNILKAFDQVQNKYTPKNMGAWVQRGQIHIDPTRIVKSYGKAQRIGRKMNQDSVYSFGANKGKGASLKVIKRGR
jgi:hypothetical protein